MKRGKQTLIIVYTAYLALAMIRSIISIYPMLSIYSNRKRCRYSRIFFCYLMRLKSRFIREAIVQTKGGNFGNRTLPLQIAIARVFRENSGAENTDYTEAIVNTFEREYVVINAYIPSYRYQK